MAKYIAPDFDVTVYEIKERIALDIGSGMDGDNDVLSWGGNLGIED